MSTASFREYSGPAAQLYQEFFVPPIAAPASGGLLRVADLQPGERVVDVACGTGVIARAAAEVVGATGSVVGVDVAPDMLAVAAEVPASGAAIEWTEGDAAALPLTDSSCDVALSQMGLMFVGDKVAAASELHRVVAPSGRVAVNTPGHISPVLEAMRDAIADNIDPNLGGFVDAVFSMPDPADLVGLLSDAGFEDAAGEEYSAVLDLPAPAEMLWTSINLTPLGAFVGPAPDAAKDAMERQFVEACVTHVVDGRLPIDQPMALAHATRG
jgi:ubiquinone/menaquinone biosynthesis C-methylase UbiE